MLSSRNDPTADVIYDRTTDVRVVVNRFTGKVVTAGRGLSAEYKALPRAMKEGDAAKNDPSMSKSSDETAAGGGSAGGNWSGGQEDLPQESITEVAMLGSLSTRAGSPKNR